MNREALINKTIKTIRQLPDGKIREVHEFADFLLSRIDDKIILDGISYLTSNSKSFEFLKEDEDIYTVNDLKERYNK